MPVREDGRSAHAPWVVLVAGLLAGVGLGVFFVVLQVTGNSAAFALSQLAYVVPPMLAAVACLGAAVTAQHGSRERRMWWLLFAVMAPIAFGEAAFSWYQVFVDPAGPSGVSLTEVAWLIGAVMLFVLLVFMAGITRLESSERIRVLSDAVVILAVLYALVYASWTRGPFMLSTSSMDAGIAAAYSVQGFVALVVAWTFWLADRARPAPTWARLAAVSFLVYAVGLFAWPVWEYAQRTSAALVTQFGPEIIYLLGYSMLATAALVRLVGGQAWEPPSVHEGHEEARAWPGVIVAGVVFAGMSVLVALTALAPVGSADEQVYFAATAVAGLGILVRSAASSLEQGKLRGMSLTDPLTGAGNHRWFHDRLAALITEARRSERTVGLVLVDVDDFGRVNDELGYPAGDEILRHLASVISAGVRPSDQVFRLSDDEFAVLMPGVGGDESEDAARGILLGVRAIRTGAGALTASVGVATFPDDADGAEELLAACVAAEVWAKCHGKDRVVASRTGVARRVSPEDQLRLIEEGMRLDLARGLAAAVDARDSSNHYHTRNVAALAVLVGERLGFDVDRLAQLEAAALLHDVGTLALSDALLQSTARSATLQRRDHAELGERFCSSIGFADVAGWVRSHHERWDGSGFPDGLEGAQIPRETRIISLCDAYDMLTGGKGERRRALSKAAALQEIDLGMGTKFDPQLTERFIAIVGGHGALGWVEAEEDAS